MSMIIHTAGDTQGLVHYKFIPERLTVNKEIYTEIIHPQGCSEKEMSKKNRHKTAGSFCTTHLYISH
jgi:hypothetical protein